MGHPRPCGCKGVRTCLVCETEFGAVKREFDFSENCRSYVYCVHCNKAWRGSSMEVWDDHPNHVGEPIDFPGIYIELNFIAPEEQERLINDMDGLPWDPSQSGRRKQNYGPKCNFKKRKMKPGDFNGFPKSTEFIQKRLQNVSILEGFMTVEQCSLEYDSERGASIDPHIDDCWVWGERVVTVNVIGDSMLTLNHYTGTHERYNLADVQTYPCVVSDNGTVVWNPFYRDLHHLCQTAVNCTGSNGPNAAEQGLDTNGCVTTGHSNNTTSFSESASKGLSKTDHQNREDVKLVRSGIEEDSKNSPNNINSYKFSESIGSFDRFLIVRVPMPARSLLVIYGAARYEWEHSVLREDIMGRRVCLAYREFTPPFLKGGVEEKIGSEVLQKAANFW